MNIRLYNPDTDIYGMRNCVIALQNFERDIDPRMPDGEEIVDQYLVEMEEKCEISNGTIFVAEVESRIIGYVQILTSVRSEELEDADIEYGLVSDLYVDPDFRGSGLGRELLSKAESHATEQGVRWLRIDVMAANELARNAYLKLGFSELFVEMEKDLAQTDQQNIVDQ